jgi:copper chaperone CopZ
MEQIAFDVPELRSRDCERTVTSALINMPGVQWAAATGAPSGVVGVQFDPRETDAAELFEAVEAAGFTAAQ